MKKKSDILVTVIFIFIFLLGLGIMLYPAFSNWWNSRVQSRAIASYDRAVGQMDNSYKIKLLEIAEEYNKALSELSSPLSDYAQIEGYEDILDITGTGIMGYITIPKSDIFLPIYHGTSPEVLNVAVGHLQGSSIPIGGKDRHAVISAHRGLPSAKLFTDIDKLVEDDTFTITILDEILTYEVDDIKIVLPYETNHLNVIPDMDCVTLMTCTPYGINTHRLLVRAHRIDTVEISEHNVRVPADAVQADQFEILTILVIPVFILLVLYWSLSGKKNKLRKIDTSIIDKLPKK